MWRHRIIHFIVGIGFIGVLFYVAQVNRKATAPIKIGLVATLTGTTSPWGTHARNGAILAVEEANRAGGIHGRPIELIVKDDKKVPSEALRVDRALIDAGVVAILGHHTSTIALKTIPLMNEHNMLVVGMGTGTAALTGIDDNLIRVMIPTDRRGPLNAVLAHDRLGLKRMAVVYDLSNPKYTESVYRHFRTAYEKRGGTVSRAIGFNSNDKFSAPDIVTAIVDSGAEGVLIVTNAIYGALICQHLRRRSTDIRVIGSVSFQDPEFIRNSGHAGEGCLFLVEFNMESSAPDFIRYKKEYRRRYGEQVGKGDLLAYEAAQVLLTALRKTGDPRNLKKTILDQRVFKGIDGDIIIDGYGDPLRTMYISEVKNGKIRTIGTIEPPTLRE